MAGRASVCPAEAAIPKTACDRDDCDVAARQEKGRNKLLRAARQGYISVRWTYCQSNSQNYGHIKNRLNGSYRNYLIYKRDIKLTLVMSTEIRGFITALYDSISLHIGSAAVAKTADARAFAD
jgi:hypothetical protein